jgi:regulator of protease activity HflC (stomatin/prohibitin superfamily)
MAEITRLPFVHHLRADSSSHVLQYRKGELRRSGRGLAFWFHPLSNSLAEVPVDDRDVSLLFHGRSADFQDVTVQGLLTYRVARPELVAERVDFTIDPGYGTYRRQPLEAITVVLTGLAQEHAWSYVATTPLREVLTDGPVRIRERVEAALGADASVAGMGIAIVSVRISSVAPTPDLEKALEAPAREKIQQSADEATFERRALAVEKERAIQENELQNQIELARRQEQLIAQQGQNVRRQTIDKADAKRIATETSAEFSRIEASAQADAVRVVEGARAEAERARMDVYKAVPPATLLGLAARRLAGKLERIDHLNVSPEMLGPMLLDLLHAGTRSLTPAPGKS